MSDVFTEHVVGKDMLESTGENVGNMGALFGSVKKSKGYTILTPRPSAQGRVQDQCLIFLDQTKKVYCLKSREKAAQIRQRTQSS